MVLYEVQTFYEDGSASTWHCATWEGAMALGYDRCKRGADGKREYHSFSVEEQQFLPCENEFSQLYIGIDRMTYVGEEDLPY